MASRLSIEDDWIYSLNYDDLVVELVNLELSTEGTILVLRERLVRFEQAYRNKIEFREPIEEFQEVDDLNLDSTQNTCIEGINSDLDNKISHEENIENIESRTMEITSQTESLPRLSKENTIALDDSLETQTKALNLNSSGGAIKRNTQQQITNSKIKTSFRQN